MSTRRFIAVITDFNNTRSRLPVRAFRHADEARGWVESIHALLCDDIDRGKNDDYVETAYVYRIRKDGRTVVVDKFDGMDRGDGIRSGWENACTWEHPTEGWGCERTRMKGKQVCAYHAKKTRYCAPEEGFWTGDYDTYKSKRQRIAQLRSDLKDEPRCSWLRLLKRA